MTKSFSRTIIEFGHNGLNLFRGNRRESSVVLSINSSALKNLRFLNNGRLDEFFDHTTFLTAFGKEGTGPGEFQYPLAVTVVNDGTVFGTDFGNNRVHKWQPIGSP